MKTIILLAFLAIPAFAAEGLATYYTTKSCQREGTSGVFTANGEKFDESALTCAMRSREWGKKIKVTNLENGKTIEVRLNDFGPGKKPTARGVIIDLTPAGFKALGAGKKGEIRVKVEPVASK
jgi:rare lipoprotein A